jgi:hypothetical protein
MVDKLSTSMASITCPILWTIKSTVALRMASLLAASEGSPIAEYFEQLIRLRRASHRLLSPIAQFVA